MVHTVKQRDTMRRCLVLRSATLCTNVSVMANDTPAPWTWLAEQRVRAGKTAAQVADEVGMARTYYSAIEGGHRRLWRNVELLKAVANAIGVDVVTLDKSRPIRPGQRHRRYVTDPSATAAA